MTKTAHTPGPWEVAYLDHNGQRVVRAEHIEVCTCWHHSVGSIEKEMEVNARLIAAAPELLEALKKIIARHSELVCSGDCGFWDVEDEEEMKLARAAISKAEGRS